MQMYEARNQTAIASGADNQLSFSCVVDTSSSWPSLQPQLGFSGAAAAKSTSLRSCSKPREGSPATASQPKLKPASHTNRSDMEDLLCPRADNKATLYINFSQIALHALIILDIFHP
ncbi:hypothetical protein WJX74_010001 [Apatococcus lobatus]|uniref:Uncharacterized protein n=1 Tax=Apatococcus lobatus TaxID=904363 RepID=A0AAW1Q9N9_9CHLO